MNSLSPPANLQSWRETSGQQLGSNRPVSLSSLSWKLFAFSSETTPTFQDSTLRCILCPGNQQERQNLEQIEKIDIEWLILLRFVYMCNSAPNDLGTFDDITVLSPWPSLPLYLPSFLFHRILVEEFQISYGAISLVAEVNGLFLTHWCRKDTFVPL